jgi:hypothetical protein
MIKVCVPQSWDEKIAPILEDIEELDEDDPFTSFGGFSNTGLR